MTEFGKRLPVSKRANDLAVSELSLFDVLRRRSIVALVTFLTVATASIASVLMHKQNYAALSHVLLVNDPSGRAPADASVDMPPIVTGTTVLLDVRERLGLSESVTDLRKAVTARVPPRSSLMTIAVQNHDPNMAIRIDNAIADSFAKLYWHLAGSRYDEDMKRLNVDVTTAGLRAAKLERRLEAASSGAIYVGSQASLDASAAHLSGLLESRGVALAQLANDRANLEADGELPAKTANSIRSEILKNNAVYSQTESLVSRDFAEYTTIRAGVKESFPGVAGFNDKITKEKHALDDVRSKAIAGPDAYSPSRTAQIVQLARDNAAVQGDLVKIDSYDQQIESLNRSLSHPRGSVPSLGALRAERDAAEAQLQTFSVALSNAEASSAAASSLGEVVVVDRATEARPTLLGPVFLFGLGLVAALVLAVGGAYLAELMVPRLIGSVDVESVYGGRVLANLRAS
jgi:uncharacterized protein involved in exopolysaccharide biosynthesis